MFLLSSTAGFSVCEKIKQTSSVHTQYGCVERLLTSKKNKRNLKTKRGKKKHKESKLCIMSTNAAQLKGKIKSFKSELETSKAAVFTVQETHYSTKGKVTI